MKKLLLLILLLIIIPFFIKSQVILNDAQWNEDCYYNIQFPTDNMGPCDRVYVGSIPIAVGQLLRYYNYPHWGIGNNSYTSNYGFYSRYFTTRRWNYSEMPQSVSTLGTPVSEFLLDVAIANSLNFSNSPYNINCWEFTINDLRYNLINYFGYSNEMLVIHRDSISNFSDLIMNELQNNRLVILEAFPPNGCSRFFLIDGYDNNGKFHINTGFGFSTFYTLDEINIYLFPYNVNQSALIGIHPNSMIINGQLKYYESSEILNGSVMLLHNNILLETVLTDQNGYFQFNNIPIMDYQLIPIINQQWSNCNSLDALLIMKHFTNIQSLTGLKLKTADTNGDCFINSLDALNVAKRFVGMINNFSIGDWIYEEISVNKTDTIVINCLNVGDVE